MVNFTLLSVGVECSGWPRVPFVSSRALSVPAHLWRPPSWFLSYFIVVLICSVHWNLSSHYQDRQIQFSPKVNDPTATLNLVWPAGQSCCPDLWSLHMLQLLGVICKSWVTGRDQRWNQKDTTYPYTIGGIPPGPTLTLETKQAIIPDIAGGGHYKA